MLLSMKMINLANIGLLGVWIPIFKKRKVRKGELFQLDTSERKILS